MYQLYSPADDDWGNLGCGKGKKRRETGVAPRSFMIRRINGRIN